MKIEVTYKKAKATYTLEQLKEVYAPDLGCEDNWELFERALRLFCDTHFMDYHEMRKYFYDGLEPREWERWAKKEEEKMEIWQRKYIDLKVID